MLRGNLIVFEGIDGAGTTTQANQLREAFVSRGLPAHVTAQPSGGPVGMIIRQVLTGRFTKSPGWAAMSLLFAADRQDQQEFEIEPNLKEGVNVICDRYVPSSAVYQSVSSNKEKSVDWILEINSKIKKPDVVFYLKISADEAARRRAARGGREELFDDPEFQRKLVKTYNKLEEIFPDLKIVTINAEDSKENIAEEIWRIVEEIRAQGAPL